MATRRRRRRRLTLAQRRRNPALRSKLPISKLTPRQQRWRRQRLTRQRYNRDPLYNPGRPLAGYDLRRAANAVTDLEYGPQEEALDRSLRNATTQGTALTARAGGYYKQMASQEAERVNRQRALGQMLNQRLDQIRGQSEGTLKDAVRDEMRMVAQDQSVRGAGLQGGSDTAKEIGALRGRAADMHRAAANQANTATGNWAGFQEAMRGSREMRGGEIQGQLLNRLANEQARIRSEREGLGRQRGLAHIKNLLDLRQTGFENLATARGLDIKLEDIQSDAEAAAERARLTERGQNITRRGQDIASADRRAQRVVTKRGQDIASADRAASRAAQERHRRWQRRQRGRGGAESRRRTQALMDDIERGRSLWASGMARHGNEAAVKRGLLRRGMPRALYNAVYDLERTGTLHPANRRALERLGMRVPREWIRPTTRRRRDQPG